MKLLPTLLFVTMILGIAGCQTVNPVPPEEPPTLVSHTYQTSDAAILNPERGFFTPYDLPGSVGLSPVRLTTGNTLVHFNIRLDDYREQNLPEDVLKSLDTTFNDVRDAGLKAIIRVAYNNGPWPNSKPDASKEQILRHIDQLKPLLQKHGDVIAWAEAGFLGAWGEWHTSTNGLDNLQDKSEILGALTAALPADRFAQVRYPYDIIQMYPDPLDAVKAKVGHHNDCFVASDMDTGTYERLDHNTILSDQAYLTVLTRYTPMCGETCAVYPPRSNCEVTLKEMALLHFSAINEGYHKGVIRGWEEEGCLPEIENRLGYRLQLVSADFNEKIGKDGIFELKVKFQNTGFSAIINPRPVFIVMEQGGKITPFKVELDPRLWLPGESTFTLKLQLPADVEGQAKLALWLPDAAEALQKDSSFSVQFANANVWDEPSGLNFLGEVTLEGKRQAAEFKVLALEHTEPVLPPYTPVEDPIPTPGEAAPEETVPAITELQGSVKEGDAGFSFAYNGKTADYNGFQLFIDTDSKADTGYKIAGIGAEIMLENDVEYLYTGTGEDWTWEEKTNGSKYENFAGIASWTYPADKLGSESKIMIAGQLVNLNWDSAAISEPVEVVIK